VAHRRQTTVTAADASTGRQLETVLTGYNVTEDRELAGLAVFRRVRHLEHIGFRVSLHNLDTAVLGEIRYAVATIARERRAGWALSAGAAGGRPGT
jgi:hypothetical protein